MAADCSVDGCDRSGKLTRGYCATHYARWLTKGDAGGPIIAPGDFWARVDKREQDDCWEWIGARCPNGYGRISRSVYPETMAHRQAWRLANPCAPMPEAVMHDCDNPPCCNPAHLMAGTRLLNNRQAWERGLHPRGDDHPRARISEQDVERIRERHRAGESQKVLALEYGVTQSHVSRLVNFKVRRAA